MAMESAESFGQLLRDRRKALDLTQEDLARLVGCARVTIRKIEYGDLRPSIQIAERLADKLEIPEDEGAAFVRLARTTPRGATPAPLPRLALADAALHDLSGRALKGYELHERIGMGGFGVVYRASQPHVGRDVAIKIIRPPFANYPEFIRRFEAEAQLVARLEHPYIVPLYDYWREPGGAYLVMRYLRGGSLHAALARGPLALDVGMQVIDQVALALMVAHRAGVVHRDLKPSNILLDDDGNAYLADFGIATDLLGEDAHALAAAGVSSGSSVYRAPEQIRAEPVTPRTDIYALGLVLYEMLTGATPFDPRTPGTTADELRRRQLAEPLPSLRGLHPELPAAFDDVIQRATAKAPADRYPDAQTLVVDLRHAIAIGHAPPNAFGTGRAEREDQAAFLTALLDTPVLPLENPYKGLRAFGEDDAADFFGRADLVERLLERLAEEGTGTRFLAVVGPSGSGKSSVVKAGVIPVLRRGGLPGSEHWFVVDLLPTAHPFEELALALRRVAADPAPDFLPQLLTDERGLLRVVERILPVDDATELVLVIDQFEELWTLVEDEAVRVHLVHALLTAISDPRSRVRLVVTLRADFYDRPLRHHDLAALMRERTEVVLALGPDELRQAIMGPAERVGVRVEPELVETMAHEVGAQPGALPLLQYALTELFEHRADRMLTLQAYRAIGGVRGALVRRADDVYSALSGEEQRMAPQIFLRLITLGEGAEDTRRRVRQAELLSLAPAPQPGQPAEPPSGAARVLAAFDRSRLLTFDHDPVTREPTVEVAHEALLREWDRLRSWIERSRADLRIQRLLGAAAAEWAAAGRDRSYLLGGARLEQFSDWAAQSRPALTEAERAVLEHSLQERTDREAAEGRRQQREIETLHQLAETEQRRATEQGRAAARLHRRALYLSAALAIALLAAGIAGVLAARNASLAAQNAAATATAQAARSVAVAEAQLRTRQQAIAQANFANAESQRLGAEANAVLQRGESAELAALLAIRGLQAQYSPQADAALQRAAHIPFGEHLLPHPNAVPSLHVSTDGTQLLTGNYDGVARLWDLQTGQVVREYHGHTDWVNNAAFSPDGRLVLTNSEDASFRLWDAQTGQELRRFAGRLENTGVAFTPDARSLLTADGDTAYLLDLGSGTQRLALTAPAAIRTATLSRDGRYVLTGAGNDAQLWDATTGQHVRTFSGHTALVMDVAFSPDQRSVLTASRDETARVWDASTGQPMRTLTGHTEQLFEATFSPDGQWVLTGSLDTTARLWDAATGIELRRFTAHTGSVYAVAFSPDGRHAYTGSKDGTVRQWDLAKPAELDTLAGHEDDVMGLAFSADGKQLLTGSADKTVRLWDLVTGRQRRVWEHLHSVDSVAFSPDGAVILTGGGGAARLWDVQTGIELRTIGAPSIVAVLSADGRSVLTAGEDTAVGLWDAQTGTLVQRFGGHLGIGVHTDLTPDARYVVTASDIVTEGNVLVWDATTGKQLRAFTDPTNVVDVAFSPDSIHVLTGGRDNIARLWDRTTGQLVRPFAGHTNVIWGVAFSPDGTRAITASLDGTARLWDVATGRQLRLFPGHANAAVGNAIISPDGRRVALGSFDGTTQLTDTDVQPLIESVCARVLRDFTPNERTVYGIQDMRPTCTKQ